MKRHLMATVGIAISIALPGSAPSQQPAASGVWTTTWVVVWSEAAVYSGAKSGVIGARTDWPAGTTPEIDWVKVLVDAGYTLEEAKWLRTPANPTRSPLHGQN